ncbi:uncharacterized protein LOC142354310 [Convolutriloba macropyga]|uniref:uncharacterized protein LOC142354310 n=1 Tax=Convolutriloba macropyga TaxID=536237 RepID=UPI003F52595C
MGSETSRNDFHEFYITANVKAVSDKQISDGSGRLTVANDNGFKYDILIIYEKTSKEVRHVGFLLSGNQFYTHILRGSHCLLHRLPDGVAVMVSDNRDRLVERFANCMDRDNTKAVALPLGRIVRHFSALAKIVRDDSLCQFKIKPNNRNNTNSFVFVTRFITQLEIIPDGVDMELWLTRIMDSGCDRNLAEMILTITLGVLKIGSK